MVNTNPQQELKNMMQLSRTRTIVYLTFLVTMWG